MYNYTDFQLNVLNQGQNVYSVNSDFVTRENKQKKKDESSLKVLTKNPKHGNEHETNKIITPDGQEFRVITTKSDPKTGFDGLAVAPVVNGEVDRSSIAVIAAGTDPNSNVNAVNILDQKIVSRDFANAVIEGFTFLSPQYSVAEEFLQEVSHDPQNTVVQLSGYSQGAYMIKLGGKYHIPTTTFNAWFLYGALTDQEKDYIQKHAPLFRDYRKRNDSVVIYNDLNNPSLFGYGDDYRTIHWLDGASHKVEDWYFDPKTGQVLDKKDGKIVISGVSKAFLYSMRGMSHFEELKNKWSAGGISSSEEIFLDIAQGEILGSSIVSAAQTAADELETLRKQADAEVQALWEAIDFSSYQYLSQDEVRALFAEQGITQDQFLGTFQEHTKSASDKMKEAATSFQTLNSQLQAVMEEKVATDRQLAGEFLQWKSQASH